MGALRNKIGEHEPALSASELVLVYGHLTVKLDSHPS